MARKYVRIDAQLAVDLYQDGESAPMIAEFLDVNVSTVYDALRKAGATRHPPAKAKAPARASRATPGAPNLSRSGGMYKGPPPGEVVPLRVVKVDQGVKTLPQRMRGGVSEAYSLTRKLAQVLDALWRDGTETELKVAAKASLSDLHSIEDRMTRAVRETYTRQQMA